MNDIAERSQKARERLAQALEVLQQPEAGELIDTVAEPVARSMAALHGIEESAGAKLATNAPLAVKCVRQAFGELQSAPLSGASVEAIYHIASALRTVFRLASEASTPPSRENKVRTSKALERTHVSSRPPARVQVQSESEPAPPAPSGGLDATMPIRPEVSSQAKPGGLGKTQVSVRPSRASEPASPTSEVSSKRPPPPEGGVPADALQIEVSLGAHSSSNFYKGLGGNDIVEDGGLFVASYEIPPLKAQLWLSVHMPGGYEFQALAEVRWSRVQSVGDASAGFGCSLKMLSAEARQLIARYARNREPLFHDE